MESCDSKLLNRVLWTTSMFFVRWVWGSPWPCHCQALVTLYEWVVACMCNTFHSAL